MFLPGLPGWLDWWRRVVVRFQLLRSGLGFNWPLPWSSLGGHHSDAWDLNSGIFSPDAYMVFVPQNGWWKSCKTLLFNGWFGGKTHYFRKHPYKAKEKPIQECIWHSKILRFFDIFEILWGEISWSMFQLILVSRWLQPLSGFFKIRWSTLWRSYLFFFPYGDQAAACNFSRPRHQNSICPHFGLWHPCPHPNWRHPCYCLCQTFKVAGGATAPLELPQKNHITPANKLFFSPVGRWDASGTPISVGSWELMVNFWDPNHVDNFVSACRRISVKKPSKNFPRCRRFWPFFRGLGPHLELLDFGPQGSIFFSKFQCPTIGDDSFAHGFFLLLMVQTSGYVTSWGYW